MRQKPYSPYEAMQTLIGTKELAGAQDNPLIMAMLQTDQTWPENDEVPWCSAAVNFVCKLTNVQRTKSLRARSWLQIGVPVSLADAEPGFDVVILNRGGPKDPNVINAPGHVGFYAGQESNFGGIAQVLILGGNQGNQVSIMRFPVTDILGIRRLL